MEIINSIQIKELFDDHQNIISKLSKDHLGKLKSIYIDSTNRHTGEPIKSLMPVSHFNIDEVIQRYEDKLLKKDANILHIRAWKKMLNRFKQLKEL